MNNVAICCIIKNTNEKELLEFIDYHLNLGIKDIHICTDTNHTESYNIDNPHVFFYDYNNLSKELNLYEKYVNFGDPCHRQNKWYSYFLFTIGLKYDWVALIDDDEYLNLDLNILDNYKTLEALFIMWRYIHNYKLKDSDPDLIMEIPMSEFIINHTNGYCFKSLVNMSFVKEDPRLYHKLACHFAFGYGADEHGMEFFKEDASINNPEKRIYPAVVNYTISVDHKDFTSFENFIAKRLDRGDSAVTKDNLEWQVNRILNNYQMFFSRHTLMSLPMCLKAIGREDCLVLLKLYEQSIDVNVGICCMVKNTPDYLIKAFVNHHLLLGVKDIYIYVDIDSNPIYEFKNSNVHYYYLTPELNLHCKEIGFNKLIDSNKDLGVLRQVGCMNYMLQQHGDKHDWIAFIDDDEFLNINLNKLLLYTDWDCVYIPWKCYYSKDLKIPNLVLNLELFIDNETLYSNRTDLNWLKSIVNTSRMKEINHIHWGNYKGVMIDHPDFRWNMGDKYILASLKNNYIHNQNYIAHFFIRSFLEWVEKVVDRKDMLKRLWMGYYYGRSLKLYFIMHLEAGELFTYCRKHVEKCLKEIGREDVLYSCEYDWAKVPVLDESKDPILIIYSIANKPILNEDIEKIQQENPGCNKTIVIDYDKVYTEKDVEFFDKNSIIAWMSHIACDLNCWDEWWILILTLRKFYPNKEEDNIKLINLI